LICAAKTSRLSGIDMSRVPDRHSNTFEQSMLAAGSVNSGGGSPGGASMAPLAA
jgi:hypothetical protein